MVNLIYGDLVVMYVTDVMEFHRDFMDVHVNLMEFNSDFIDFHGDLMECNGDIR